MKNSSNEVPLRDHFKALLEAEAKRTDERFEGEVRRTDDRFEAIERALTTSYTTAKESLIEAKTDAEKAAEKQNEWRGSINDVITTRISREEHEASRRPAFGQARRCNSADWQDRGPRRWYEHHCKLFPHDIGLTCHVSIRDTLTNSWILKQLNCGA
jgi:hypothetical protein